MNLPMLRTVLLGVLLLPVVELSGQTLPIVKTLVGHTAAVNSAIYTANQKYVVTAGADQVIKIWDAQTGKEVSTLLGHTAPVLSLANSPDGSVIISGGADNSIRMWDVPRKDPTRIFAGPALGARGVAVSRNGQWAVSFSAKDGKIWNLRDGKVLFPLVGQQAVNAVATRPDNNQFASGDARGQIWLWSPFDGKSRGVIGGHEGRITGLVYHPNSQQLISTGSAGQLKVWQLPLPVGRGFAKHTMPVRAVTLTSNGQLAVTGSDDGVRIVNVSNGQIVRKLAQVVDPTRSVAVTSNNSLVAAAGLGGVIRFWNLSNGTDRLHIRGNGSPINALTFHPGNTRLASAAKDGSISVWRVPQPPRSVNGHTADVVAGAFSRNGQLAATASSDKSAKIWNSTNAQLIRQLQGHQQPLTSIEFDRSDSQLATSDVAGELRLWNVGDGASRAVFGAHTGAIRGMAFDPQNKTLASVGDDLCLKIWNLPQPPARELTGNGQAVNAVVLAAKGQFVITGGADKSIRFYNPQNRQQIRTLPGSKDIVTALALDRTDAIVAAGDNSGSIKLWNTADGTPWKGSGKPSAATMAALSELLGHKGAISALKFDAKSQHVISAGKDGTIRVWRLPQAPRVIRDKSGPSSKFVVSLDGKLAASAHKINGRDAIVVRELVSGKTRQTLLGHKGPITSLAFSADGKKLVSGSSDKTTRLWNLSVNKNPEVKKLTNVTPVTAVAVSADGQFVFTSAGDSSPKIWSVASAKPVRTLPKHGGTVIELVVRGQTLFSAATDGIVRLWNRQTGALIRNFAYGGAIKAFAVSSNAQLVASAGADKQVKLWRVANGQAVASMQGHTVAAASLTFSADGSRLASAGGDGIWMWDTVKGHRLETITGTTSGLMRVAFSGQAIVGGATDGSIRFLTPHLTRIITGHVGGVTCIAVTPDGKKLVSSGADKVIRLWNLGDGKQLATFAGTKQVADVAISSDGKRLIAGGLEKTLSIWPLPARGVAQPIPPLHQWKVAAAVLRVGVSLASDRVVLACSDNMIRVWNVSLGQEVERFKGHTAKITSVGISPDGKTVVSGCVDKTARVRSVSLAHLVVLADKPNDVTILADGTIVAATANARLSRWKPTAKGPQAIATLPAAGVNPAGFESQPQTALAVRADGKQLASLDKKGRLNVWNTADDQLALSLAPPKPVKPKPKPAKSANLPTGGVRFSSDNKTLAVAHANELYVIDLETGKLVEQLDATATVTAVGFVGNNQSLFVGSLGTQKNVSLRPLSFERLIKAHKGSATDVQFSPQGNDLISCGEDKLVRWWSVTDGKLIREYIGASGALNSVALTRDAKLVIAAGLDKVLRIWPSQPPAAGKNNAGKPPQVKAQTTVVLPSAILSLSISADNLKVAIARDDGVVSVREIATGIELQRFAAHQKPSLGVAFSTDNKTLVSAGSDPSVRVSTLAIVRRITAEEGPVNDLTLSGGGGQAVTAGADGVKQWNLGNGSLLRKFAGGEVAFTSLHTRRDNAQLVAADVKHNLFIWNLGNGQPVAKVQLPSAIQQVRYSPDNLKIVAACGDRHLRFYDAKDGKLTCQISSTKGLSSAVFLTNSRHVLTGGESLRQWQYASPTEVKRLNGHGGGVHGLTYSADGRWIASASADQTVRIWNATTGVSAKRLAGHRGAVYSVAFSPDGALLISAGAEKNLRLWDTLGGRQLKQIPVGKQSLYSVAFFADGKRVAAAGLDRKIYLLDAFTGALQNTLDKHPDFLHRITFNKKGTRLLSCGYGGNIMMWNAANGQQMFATNLARVANFADFAPDGNQIVVAGSDGKAYLLEVPTNAR